MVLSKCSLDMLQEMGLRSIEELFTDIPAEVRTGGLKLPDGLGEMELRRELDKLLSTNRTVSARPSFLGAGVYHHFIPAAVRAITSRSEFITAYTPYQPEISQGMLQSLFEYQSYMSELTGMDAVNCSMYDGSTALGEAVLMSNRIAGGGEFLLSRAVSPEKKRVAELYASGADITIKEVGYEKTTGQVDLDDLRAKLSDNVSGFYFETPSFFGTLETKADEIRRILGNKMMVVGVNPLSLALVKPPADFGADIVIGDAQVFGIPMSLGGPMIGLFGCKIEHARKMPGRIIGMTTDAEGKRSFTMTLRTREQDIRRSKATSNICTNEALLALAATVHLAILGRSGLREVAARNVRNMMELSRRIAKIKGFVAPAFEAPHFNEFVVRSDVPSDRIHKELLARDIQGGFVLDRHFPELKNSSLYATTEMHSRQDFERLISALEAIG